MVLSHLDDLDSVKVWQHHKST